MTHDPAPPSFTHDDFTSILVFASIFLVAALVVGFTTFTRRRRTSASPVRRADRRRVRDWLTQRRRPADDAAPPSRP